MNAETTATKIREIYTATTKPGQWMAMWTVQERLDATIEELRAGVRYLRRNDPKFFDTEETNQKALSAGARKHRVVVGATPTDVMRWS